MGNSTTKRNCENCKFWDCDQPEQYIWGYCKRLPPQCEMDVVAEANESNGHYRDLVRVRVSNTKRASWPQTHKTDDWCGEHQQKTMREDG